MSLILESLSPDHWENVSRIYQQGIDTKHATFELELPSKASFYKRFEPSECFVGIINEVVVGWIGLSKVSTRSCYDGVRELTIYVGKDHQRKGIGNFLMKRIIKSSEGDNIWTLQSRIFPENEATVQLHLKHGFRIVGKRERIAQLDGKWRDTLDLERRSKKVDL